MNAIKSNFEKVNAAVKSPNFIADAIVFFVLALLSSFYGFIVLNLGIGYSWDSGVYGALAAGLSIFNPPDIQGQYPPFYSGAIALGIKLGLSLENSVVLLNVLSLLTISFYTYKINFWISKKITVSFLVGIAVFIFSFGNMVFQFAWTEPFFAAVLILSAYYAVKSIDAKEISVSFLIFCSLLPVIRYFGVYYLAWMSVFLIFALRKSISWLGVLKVLSCWVPFSLLVTKNKIQSGEFFGVRAASPYGVWENIDITFKVIANDLNFVFPFGVFALTLFLVFRLYRQKVETLKVRKADDVLFLVGIIFTSLICQIYSSSTVHIDPISTRFYFPIYPIFFVAISLVLSKESIFRFSSDLLCIFLACVMVYFGVRNVGVYEKAYGEAIRQDRRISMLGHNYDKDIQFARLILANETDGVFEINIAFVGFRQALPSSFAALVNDYFPRYLSCRLTGWLSEGKNELYLYQHACADKYSRWVTVNYKVASGLTPSLGGSDYILVEKSEFNESDIDNFLDLMPEFHLIYGGKNLALLKKYD